ncbi:hypothetical protein GOV14_01655 [Candidatus Pacearchaeota archaeon]|nr:hypothetical protein [Candidatus Pacearchaeota archaeon]
MDALEMSLLRMGYELAVKCPLSEDHDPVQDQSMFPNIKELYNKFKHLGFNEESVVHIKSQDKGYIARIYTKNSF